uniref:Uncharacterized protein n=1 Tax=Anguilla anguilla TaxID=7936 RepID=A0A0E9V5T0_ANGAN
MMPAPVRSSSLKHSSTESQVLCHRST